MEQNKVEEISPRQRDCLLHQCFFWLYHVAVFTLGMVMLAKIAITFHTLQQVRQSPQLIHAQQTISLWQKNPIIDIKSVSTNNCPEGYDSLLSYNWTGTSQGCYCKVTVNNHTLEYILNGLCTTELITEGCKQVDPMGVQELRMWKGGKLICVKRAKGTSFYDSVNEKTPEGLSMTVCSENKTYQTTTLPNITCPITQVSNTSLPSSTPIPLSATEKLSYITQSHYPIADFKIAQNSFCPFLHQINISPNKIGNYKLQIMQYTPCEGTDPRYQIFDQLNQEDFYTNNTRVYDKITQLPAYPRPSTSYNFKLGYIRYPEWTYQCRSSQKYNLNVASEHLLFTKQQSSLETLFYVTIPCIIIFSIFFRIFFALRHIIHLRQRMLYNAVFLTENEIQEQLPNLNIKPSKSRQTVIFFIESGLRVTVLVFVLIGLLRMFDTSVWIKDVINYKCTEEYVINLLLYYQHNVDLISEILIQVCFIWSFMFIVDILWLFMRFKYTDLSFTSSLIPQESQLPQQSEQLDPINAQKHKQLQLPEQSSQTILQKDRSRKISNIDEFMLEDVAMAGQTKDNFYGDIETSDYNLITSKKKKKRPLKKKKNLFKNPN